MTWSKYGTLTQWNCGSRPDVRVAHIITDGLKVVDWDTSLILNHVIMGRPGCTLNGLVRIQVYECEYIFFVADGIDKNLQKSYSAGSVMSLSMIVPGLQLPFLSPSCLLTGKKRWWWRLEQTVTVNFGCQVALRPRHTSFMDSTSAFSTLWYSCSDTPSLK